MAERARSSTRSRPHRSSRSARPSRARGGRGRHQRSATAPSPRVTRRRRLLLGVLAALALVGFLFAFAYPTRTYLDQREQIRRAEERLTVLQRQTAALERDTLRLQGDAEVERIAREQYGLVRPGETPYVIVPPETTPLPTP
jgi:cell division protein FtsB